jgi:hypothetical protein
VTRPDASREFAGQSRAFLDYPLGTIQALVDQSVAGTEIVAGRRFPDQLSDDALFAEYVGLAEVLGHLRRMDLEAGKQFTALGAGDNGSPGENA